jgi:hypothetical protein
VLPSAVGGVSGDRRIANFADPFGIVPFFIQSLNNIMFQSYRVAFGPSLEALIAKGWGWVLPLAITGAGLIVTGGWMLARRSLREEEERPDLRPWVAISLAGLIMTLPGLALLYLYLGSPVPVEGLQSRNTTIAMMGVSLLYGQLVVFPLLAARRWAPRWQAAGLVACGVLTTLLLAGGIMQQMRTNIVYTEAWRIQRAYLQGIANLEISAQPDHLVIVLDSFPKGHDGAPLAAHKLGNTESIRLLFDLPPDLVTFNEADAITHTLTDEMISVTTDDGELTVPLENFRVLHYDGATGLVEVAPHLPLSWTSEREYIYTGENPDQARLTLSRYGATLLGAPIAAGQCQTRVPIHSIDAAPADGVVEVALYPQNVVLDRRRVTHGTSLAFSFMAPCGVWIRTYFVRDGGSTEMLVSQYGEGQEYGTSEEAASPSYETAFEKAVGAEPLH